MVVEPLPLPDTIATASRTSIAVTVESVQNVVLEDDQDFLNYIVEAGGEIVTPPIQPEVSPQTPIMPQLETQLPYTGINQLPVMLTAGLLLLLGLAVLALGLLRYKRV
ncbi:MAG: hypothetical protein SWK76_03865 [Actinomycetota bacterium]|nr:hypothetical protein [Actinomycetota bacterium]